MTTERKKDPKSKALAINLDTRSYGSFAEIGAGQEVAAAFFKAGAASQTIAKTMSAYDMTFSDTIYGAEESGRYVSESRLMKMVNKEYSLMEIRLKEKRKNTLFFAYANTMVALNFKKDNQGHGWMGIRFQLHPETPPNDVVIHANMKDNDTILQQQAVGILGVNLIYAAFYLYDKPEEFVISLLDSLSANRIEVDMLRVKGPDFRQVDNRLLSLLLVKNKLTKAALFGPSGDVLQPSDVFYKKNIFAYRGNFRPFTNVNADMLKCALDQFLSEPNVNKNNLVVVSELTLFDLSTEGEIDYTDYLQRVDILCSLGQIVLISDYQGYYRLADYLTTFTKQQIGIVLGIYNLQDIFEESYYKKLKGGILESFSQLFANDIKLYVYPALHRMFGHLYTLANFEVKKELKHLYQYILENDKLHDVKDFDKDVFHIHADQVFEMIQSNEENWETKVPAQVAKTIKDKKMFGYGRIQNAIES